MSTRTLIRRLTTAVGITSICFGNRTRQIPMASQEQQRTPKTFLLALTLFCVGLGSSVTVFVTQAHRQNVPTVVLQASERVRAVIGSGQKPVARSLKSEARSRIGPT